MYKKLFERNKNFVEGKLESYDFVKSRINNSASQNPHTIVVTCSDSRVVPEFIFNCDLGEIFVIRTAGNILCDVALGTVEFAMISFDIKQIIVMGHTNCGAVQAALDGNSSTKYLKSISEELRPIVNVGLELFSNRKEILHYSIIQNVKKQLDKLQTLELVKERWNKGELYLIPAIYHLDSGLVELLNDYRWK
ncbi:MAG: carbonic anhydrase [Ignavibacteria bacterium]|nr:carbonic anhydrase [Ignavibacteria bacterium]